jgi:Effector Associated Constant Component 1
MEPDRTIILHLAGDEESDVEEVAQLSSYLRRELLELDVEDVEHVPAVVPAGAKGAAFEWAQLAVTMAGTAVPLIGALRGWLGRHRECSVTLEIDGDRLTLSGVDAAEQSRLANVWLERHGIT